MTNAALRLAPTRPHLRLLMTDPNDRDHSPTARTTPAPPTDRDTPTNPAASEAPIQGSLAPGMPAIPPPAMMPVPPSTLEATYFVEAAKHFGAAAIEMRLAREGAARQHRETMDGIVDLGRRSDANYELLRDAVEKHGRRLDLIEDGHSELRREIAAIKDEMRNSAARLEQLEAKLSVGGQHGSAAAASKPSPG